MNNIDDRLAEFNSDILTLPIATIVQKHITYGSCYILEANEYFKLKSDIADNFGVHPSNVLVVGSGKLGFSIVQKKLYRPFNDTSDIDVAIVSNKLFDNIWFELFDYERQGSYWPKADDFKRYLFKGWMRPDMLPPERSFALAGEWWKYFQNLTASGEYGPYNIKAGLYKSWYFLEEYSAVCVRECQKRERGLL